METIDNLHCAQCGYDLRGLWEGGTCPECGLPVEETRERLRDGPPRPMTLHAFSIPWRMVLFVLGVVLPIVPFAAVESSRTPLTVEWQSGKVTDYIGMLLGGPPARPFYPLLLLSMASLAAVLIRPAWGIRHSWLRWGVYSGVPLALQYGLIEAGGAGAWQASAIVIIVTLVGYFVAAGIDVGAAIGLRSLRARQVRAGGKAWPWAWIMAGVVVALWLLMLGLSLLASIFDGLETTAAFIGTPIAMAVFAAPVPVLFVYAEVSIRMLLTHDRVRSAWLTRSVFIVIWLGYWVLAWAASIILAVRWYRTLPTTEPMGCYVCTAAATGHRWVTRGELHADGVSTRQLQTLRAAEAAVAQHWPSAHRATRRLYDRVGPRLAAVVRRSPWLADTAYLSLKPAQWAARRWLASLEDHHAG